MGADSMANPLRNTELEKVEILAREALQNSYDERLQSNKDPIRFKCKRHILLGEEKERFIKSLNLKTFQEIKEFFPASHHWFQEGSNALEDLDDPDKPFPVLEVSDYNANGLGGRWNRGQSIDDRFYNLVLSINKTKKQDEASETLALGSYGVGKMVFALCSNLRTMVYYSRFADDVRSDGARSRLMATAFLPTFERQDHDLEYSGHAYFGIDSGETQNPKKPYENEQADQMISSLGFTPRKDDDFGTTVLLPCCDIQISELRDAIEKWWWPLLSDPETRDFIQIDLEDEAGVSYSPNPSIRSHLKPFIHCLNNMGLDYKDDQALNQDVVIIHEQEKKVAGNLSLTGLSKKKDGVQLENNVAFVRGGLVIQYNDQSFREEGHPSVGVFKANNNYQKFFVFSEPEAHDQWNQHHDRLKTFMGQAGSDFIRQCLKSIETKARDFQISQEQTKKVKASDTLSFLDDLLGNLIKPRKRGKPEPPPPSNRLPFIHKEVSREISSTTAIDAIDFTVGLSEEDGPSELDYNLIISLKTTVDSSGKPDEFIPINISLDDAIELKINEAKPLQITLKKGENLTGRARAEVHPAWMTCWTISLEVRNEGKTDD